MKFLASTSILVGGGIVAPIYFVSITHTKLTSFISELSEGRPYNFEATQKVTCTSQDISKLSTSAAAYGEFLKEQNKDIELYDYVNCSDTISSREDKSLLGKNWEGFFPKDILSNFFSRGREMEKFEINVKSTGGWNPVTVFKNIAETPSISVRWVDIVEAKYLSSTNKVETLVEEGSNKGKVIYLLLKTLAQQTENVGH